MKRRASNRRSHVGQAVRPDLYFVSLSAGLVNKDGLRGEIEATLLAAAAPAASTGLLSYTQAFSFLRWKGKYELFYRSGDGRGDESSSYPFHRYSSITAVRARASSYSLSKRRQASLYQRTTQNKLCNSVRPCAAFERLFVR